MMKEAINRCIRCKIELPVSLQQVCLITSDMSCTTLHHRAAVNQALFGGWVYNLISTSIIQSQMFEAAERVMACRKSNNGYL